MSDIPLTADQQYKQTYDAVEESLRGVRAMEGWRHQLLATVNDSDNKYDVHLFHNDVESTRPNVWISGGVHGDEPAGVWASIAFLKGAPQALREAFNFFVVPCVNPTGFQRNTLESARGRNLNRLFGTESDEVEVRAVEHCLNRLQLRFRLAFDLHEIPPDYVGEGFEEKDNPRSCYLYETPADNQPIGQAMLDRLPRDFEVCDWPSIYLDDNDRGVVLYPQGAHNEIYLSGTSLDSFLKEHFADHTFTLETPTGWSMTKRIRTHLLWIDEALSQIGAHHNRRLK